MRTDIEFDYETEKIVLKKISPQYMVDFVWDSEDDYFLYGTCYINPDINLANLYNGVGVNIPFVPSEKRIRISFKRNERSGNLSPIINPMTGEQSFYLYTPDRTQVKASKLPMINYSGKYRIILDGSMAFVSDFEDIDVQLCESISQNKVFLLQCCPGNIYQYPTTGVGIFRFLHSNVETSGLGEKIKQEFNQDNMYVTSAEFDQETNSIRIEATEV